MIRIILTDPDRHLEHADPDLANLDRYQFHANEKVDNVDFLPGNCTMLSKILKNMTRLTLMRKIKHLKVVNAATKS